MSNYSNFMLDIASNTNIIEKKKQYIVNGHTKNCPITKLSFNVR